MPFTSCLPFFIRIVLPALFIVLVLFPKAAFPQNTLDPSSPNNPPVTEQKYDEIVLAIPYFSGDWAYEYANLVYEEIFRRLGHDFQFVVLPPERALVEANVGRLDGNAGRIEFDATLKERYPNLIRVNEPLTKVTFGAYSKNGTLKVDGWNSLKDKDILIGFDRGVKMCEIRLPLYVKARNLFPFTDYRLGFKMLDRGRIDLVIQIKTTGDALLKQKKFEGTKIKYIGDLETVPVYPYLNKKHTALVPKLAEALRAIKKDGTYDRLMDQSMKNLSATEK